MSEPHNLNLDGWKTLSSIRTAARLVVHAEYLHLPAACPTCHGPINSKGPYTFSVVDMPHDDHPVQIKVRRRRYRCLAPSPCESFKQPLPDIVETQDASRHSKHHMTRRARALIEDRALRRSNREIARSFGTSEPVVNKIRDALVADLNRGHVIRAPFWLGVDEKHFGGRSHLVLTDLGRVPARIVDVLADDAKATLIDWLTNVVPNPSHIQSVTMDARDGFRKAVNTALPACRVILDRAHVASAAARAKRDPVMVKAWERLNVIWDLPDAVTAAAAFDQWAASLTAAEEMGFAEFLRRWREWRDEILGYFENRQTNAGAESQNGQIELVARSAQHTSFQTQRARILFQDYRPNYDLCRCDRCGARGRDGSMTMTDIQSGPDGVAVGTSWNLACRSCVPQPGPSGTGSKVEIVKLPRVVRRISGTASVADQASL